MVKKKIKHFLIQDKLRAMLFIIAGFVVLSLITSYFLSRFGCKMTFVEIVYYSTQVLAAVFIVASAIFAGFQYYISETDNHKRLQVEQIQKAIDLAEYYKNNILDRFVFIKFVYNETGIIDVLQNTNHSNYKEFDMDEASQLYSPNDLKKMKDIYHSDRFADAIILGNTAYGFLNKNIGREEDIDASERIKLYNAFIKDYVTDMLNNMEFFAMHFTHNTADESVIYQSLSQSYLEIVNTLYFNIAKCNENTVSKYYTNVIELYTIWKERTDGIQNGIREEKHKQLKKGNIC